jgi:hypothetical protein
VQFGYGLNYLIDIENAVIVDGEVNIKRIVSRLIVSGDSTLTSRKAPFAACGKISECEARTNPARGSFNAA